MNKFLHKFLNLIILFVILIVLVKGEILLSEYPDLTYIRLDTSNDPLKGNLNASEYNITADYYLGQPMDGSIGCGIIYSSENELECGCINVSDEGGRDVKYPDLTIRIVDTENTVTYCNLTSSTVTTLNDAHTVYYIDTSCILQTDSFDNYFSKDISPGNYCRLFDVKTYNNDIEILKGASLSSVSARKSRRINVETSHLTVVSGMTYETGTFPRYNISLGSYQYINTIVSSIAQDSLTDGIHLIGYSGGDVIHNDYTGIYLANCTDGTDVITCPTNKYRRYLIGMEGWGSINEIHQFYPHTSDDTFNNFADCINTAKYPLEFNYLSASEKWAFVKLYAYCGLRDDVAWRDGWIRLDGVGTQISGSPDLSVYYTKTESDDRYINEEGDVVVPNSVFDWQNSTFKNISGVSGSGKVVCVKTDGNLGVCSDAPAGDGTCSCV